MGTEAQERDGISSSLPRAHPLGQGQSLMLASWAWGSWPLCCSPGQDLSGTPCHLAHQKLPAQDPAQWTLSPLSLP